MTPGSNATLERATAYAERRAIKLEAALGAGYDGNVFSTDRKSAIKVLKFQELYERERNIYLRLQERQVVSLAGCSVPQLIDTDDSLWTIEMTIVSSPYALDFAAPTSTSGPIIRRTFVGSGSVKSEDSLAPTGNTSRELSWRLNDWGSTWLT